MTATLPRGAAVTRSGWPGSLPRDTRDTLFILAVVGWILLPLTGTLPLWSSALAYGLLLWRSAIAVRQQPLPNRWALAGVLVLVVGLTLTTYKTIFGADAGVTLVAMLLALKTLEMRARRDALVVFFLGFFTLLSNFLHSQSLLTAAAIIIGLLGLLTAVVNAHMPVGRPPLRHMLGLALKMVLIGAPLTLALFVFFPRMAPLWGVPDTQNSGKTGLSDEMTVGSVASLAQDDAIAFRVRFAAQPPAQNQLYFRGPVLSDFDGLTWRTVPSFTSREEPLLRDMELQGEPLHYELTLEPHRKPWLLALDMVSAVPQLPRARAYRTQNMEWLSTQTINEVMRVEMQSHLQFRYGMQAPQRELAFNSRLPATSSPRTRAWVQQLQAEIGNGPDSARQLVQRLLAQLRNGGYIYTLDPGLYGNQAADEFWFDRKEGFCEHISAAFVIAMRSAGVPARVVTGYQGGENNPVDGYWTVRQADAHAWAEVWLGPQDGWVRIDPTGAVSPGRIGASQRLNASNFMGFGVNSEAAISTLQRMRAVWEAVNNSWNQWVLNYTQREQMDMLHKLGLRSPNWLDLVRILGVLVLVAAVIGAIALQYQRRRTDPWLALMQQARKRLAEAGIESSDNTTPRGLARALRQRYPTEAVPFVQWLQAMEQWRYAASFDKPAATATLLPLRRQLRQLPWTGLRARPGKV